MYQFTLNGETVTYDDKAKAEKWNAIFKKTSTNQVSDVVEAEQEAEPVKKPIFFFAVNDERVEFDTLEEAQAYMKEAKKNWYNRVDDVVYTHNADGWTVPAEPKPELPHTDPMRIHRLNTQEEWDA